LRTTQDTPDRADECVARFASTRCGGRRSCRVKSLLSDAAGNLRRRTAGLYALLIGANLAAWAWALLALHRHPVLLGTAALAYTFGLRHAVDADHIAAIDNVTRTLMQAGKRPIAAGFFFSLGHSAVVFAMSAGVAAAATVVESKLGDLKAIGAVVGTCTSAIFLFAIAVVNVAIFGSVYRTFRSEKAGNAFAEEDLNVLLSGRGLLTRLFRPLFRMVSRSWHLFPIGLLFGLGFDTATEVGLFGISAAQTANGVSLSVVLVFPALFAAAMALVDTTDSVLMVGAYGWAFTKPIRKLFYNMTITLVSAAVAMVIGGIEALGLIADQLTLRGAFWDAIGDLNDHWGALGYAIIALFAASWLGSLAVYRLKRYDDIEVRAEVTAP
jgi:high-affinity nickel-transport protein